MSSIELHKYFNFNQKHSIYINNNIAKEQKIDTKKIETKLINGDSLEKITTIDIPEVRLLKRLKSFKYKGKIIYYKE